MKEMDDLLQVVLEEARSAGIPVSNAIHPVVQINRRALTRFGCCVYKNGIFTIQISDRLLASSIACKQTLMHEALHTCPGCKDHGKRWKLYAEKVNTKYGYSVARTDSHENLGVEKPAVEVRHLLVCAKCGIEIHRLRHSPLTRHPDRYRCKCGGKLILRF